MTTKLMHVTTPQILWHGGGVTDGKADPVYSVDFHPKENVLLTTGIDASVPPRGSIRLWKIEADREEERFLVDFSEHGSVVNVARFSPCGTMIASASDKQVIVYRLLEPFTWAEVEELKQVERKRFTPSLNDIVDLAWSPDSSYIIIGALEQKPEILRIASKEKQRENSVLLPSHGNYVQGVTWDPYNQFVATQSADRSVKVHKMSYRENTMVKLAPNGHVTIKMYANPNEKEESSGSDWQSANTPEAETANATSESGSASKKKRGGVGINLFADSNVPSSFRRLSFSPDGSLLIVPTGVFRPQALPNTSANTSSSTTTTTNNKNESKNTSFCTHIFARSHLQHPVMSLLGLEDPSVAVRCCPVLFQPLPHTSPPSSQQSMLIRGDYRMVFAVVTVTSVYLYDTQHCFPLAKFRGLHYAPINDVAWSGDGRVLVLCSSDGYLSFVRFKAGALGEPLPTDKVPDVVKLARPGAYDVSHLKTIAPPSQATSITTATTSPTSQDKVEEMTSPSAEPLTAVTTSTETATSNTTKKRKRIQPEVVKAETEVMTSQESQSPKKAKTQPSQPSDESNAENSVSNSLTEMTSEAQ